MNSELFSNCCLLLTSAATISLNAKRQTSSTSSRHAQLFNELFQGLALGIISISGVQLTSQKYVLNRTFTLLLVTPMAVIGATSILARIVRHAGANHLTDGPQNIDRKLANYLDLIIHISSIALLILLAPNAKQDPVIFGFALCSTGLNIVGSC